MAIAARHLTNGSWAGITSASFNSAVVVPSASELILAAVFSAHYANDGTHSPALTGNNLTWTQVAQVVVSNGFYVLTVFRALSGTPNSGAITISFGGSVQDECYWTVEDIAGVVTTGANGTDAVVQSLGGQSGAATGFSLTLAPFTNIYNGAVGFFAQNGNTVLTPGVGYAGLTGVVPNFGSTIMAEWTPNLNRTVDMTSDTSQGWEAIGLEIQAATVPSLIGPATPPLVWATRIRS